MSRHYLEHTCGADRAYSATYMAAIGSWMASCDVDELPTQSDCRCELSDDEAAAMAERVEEHEVDGCGCGCEAVLR